MKKLLLLLPLILGLAACSAGPPPVYYRVDYKMTTEIDAPEALDLTLAVKPLVAPDPLSRPNILYRTSARTIQNYSNHLWESSPAKIVSDYLVMAFQASGIFERVISSRLPSGADLILQGRLTRFEEVDRPQGWFAEAAMWLELHSSQDRLLLWSEDIYASVKATDRTTEALAEAMGQAMKACIDQTLSEVAKVAAEYEYE